MQKASKKCQEHIYCIYLNYGIYKTCCGATVKHVVELQLYDQNLVLIHILNGIVNRFQHFFYMSLDTIPHKSLMFFV